MSWLLGRLLDWHQGALTECYRVAEVENLPFSAIPWRVFVSLKVADWLIGLLMPEPKGEEFPF
jgi:hypothetical protein